LRDEEPVLGPLQAPLGSSIQQTLRQANSGSPKIFKTGTFGFANWEKSKDGPCQNRARSLVVAPAQQV
jgi:hypothetical protein